MAIYALRCILTSPPFLSNIACVYPTAPFQALLVSLGGSRRYNINAPDSDHDFLVVYAASTDDVLSLDPPLLQMKLSRPDVTIWELRRFCEHLRDGTACQSLSRVLSAALRIALCARVMSQVILVPSRRYC